MIPTAPLAVLLAAVLAAPTAPVPARKKLTQAEAEALVRDVSAKVEKIRGLRFKTPVAVKVISGADARAEFKSKISEEAAKDALHTQNVYIQLGLVPPSTDLVKGYLDLAEKDVLGYYEHGRHTFYVLDHVSADEVRGVMAHELTHALEDQNFDLAEVSKKAEGNPDRQTAITALVEGSAMTVMLAYLYREQGKERASQELEKTETKRAERLSIAPSFTQRTLLLPYLLGFTFLLQGKPWEFYIGDGVLSTDIDAVYANPPFSTRQILHPEQYWIGRARYSPPHLTLPDLKAVLGPGWSKATEGSIGELGLAVLTGSRQGLEMPWALLPSRWTNEAAIGCEGDVYHHYVSGDKKVTILLTRWESSLEAEQFDRALLNKGRYYFRYGVNIVVMAGDLGDRGQPLAAAIMKDAKFWK